MCLGQNIETKAGYEMNVKSLQYVTCATSLPWPDVHGWVISQQMYTQQRDARNFYAHTRTDETLVAHGCCLCVESVYRSPDGTYQALACWALSFDDRFRYGDVNEWATTVSMMSMISEFGFAGLEYYSVWFRPSTLNKTMQPPGNVAARC